MGTIETLAALRQLTRGSRPIIVPAGIAALIKAPSHYAPCGPQVREFLNVNGIPEDFYAGCVIKYLLCHPYKNGPVNVRKALRYCEMLIAIKLKCDDYDRRKAGIWDTDIPDGLY